MYTKLLFLVFLLITSQNVFSNNNDCIAKINKHRNLLNKATTSDKYRRPTHLIKTVKNIETSVLKIENECSNNTDVILLLVDTNLKLGKNKEAINNAKRALDLEPKNPLTNQYYSMALSTIKSSADGFTSSRIPSISNNFSYCLYQ